MKKINISTEIVHHIGNYPIHRLAISPDNCWLAIAELNKWEIEIRSLTNPNLPPIRHQTQSQDKQFRFLTNRALLAVADSNYLKGYALDNATQQKELLLISKPIYPIGSFALTADSSRVIISYSKMYVTASRAGVQSWKLPLEGKASKHWSSKLESDVNIVARGLGLLPNEQSFVIVEQQFNELKNCYLEKAVVYNANTGKKTYELPAPPPTFPDPFTIDLLATNPQLPQAVGIISGNLMVWEIKPDSVHTESVHSSSPFYDIAFHPNGKLLAAASWEKIHLLDTSSWKSVWVSTNNYGRTSSLAISLDGQWLASGTMEGKVLVHSLDMAS